MKSFRVRLALLLVFVAVLITGIAIYSRAPASSNDTLAVSTTFYPLYDFSRQVGGPYATVTNMTPAGAEPHEYEPSPQQLATAQRSRVIVYDGGRLEPWIGNFLKDYQHVAVAAYKPGTDDPHFWLDPVLASQAVDKINRGFQQADPAHAGQYDRQATAYQQQLSQLDSDFRNGLKDCDGRTVVTAHDAFGYLAKRYNFKVIAIAGLSPEAEPSAAKLAEVVAVVRRNDIHTIFFESLTSPQLAQTIARESGATTAVLDPIEGISQSDQAKGKDYISVQRENLNALRSALACR